uniref:Lipid-binding serum glycoprotein N-terminal domain-containing protein n=1 Tax=Ditylenchus dipsaci TaxID=166011 RepID=A0A915D4P9_9BILA
MNVSPLLFQNTNPANPGIFVRLMPTGLAYLREIGMKVVNDEILKINLPTITETIDAGQVSIYNAYVSKYWPPVEYALDLVGPDTFTWSMSKMHIRASGNFDARLNGALLLPSVPIQGEFESLLGHIGLTISVRMLSEEAPLEHRKFNQCIVGRRWLRRFECKEHWRSHTISSSILSKPF